MAIIWRVFIVTLFSYLGRFHSYPAHANTELNQMLYQAARWTDSGGLYNLWWSDWIFGLGEHFTHLENYCRSLLLRTAVSAALPLRRTLRGSARAR